MFLIFYAFYTIYRISRMSRRPPEKRKRTLLWIISKSVIILFRTAYVDVGGYNVISVDWGVLAGNRNYMWPAMISSKIGSRVAKVLDNIVELGIVRPKDIHLIGHSLGAHVAGACGSSFKSGKIGRITGWLHTYMRRNRIVSRLWELTSSLYRLLRRFLSFESRNPCKKIV